MQREYYYYLRDERHRPVITVCLIKRDNIFGRGVSFCSMLDQPSKRVGKAIAKIRALHALQTKTCSLETAFLPFKFYKSHFQPEMSDYEEKMTKTKKKRQSLYTYKEFVISQEMMAEIDRYINERKEPSSFLKAVVCNDLRKAVIFAEADELPNIPAFVTYFYNEAPSLCWGSALRLKRWLTKTELKAHHENETDSNDRGNKRLD